MPRPAGTWGPPSFGLLGLYALSMMEKEGRVYGYRIADRISERTDGSWKPGPGAIYPSLQNLVTRGLARRRVVGRRREYEITGSGRALLTRVRRRHAAGTWSRPDLSALWVDVTGNEELDRFLLRRHQRTLEALQRRLERASLPHGQREALRRAVERQLSRGLQAARSARLPTRPRTPRGRGSPR